MAIEKVKEYFSRYGMEERVRELDMSSATVELAFPGAGLRALPDCEDALVQGGRPGDSRCGGGGREN